ncbi:hypothetical protein AGMMS49949_05390 [Alphaproteobacteria bacterium]|nr:hypothetical protein AGMMS49949_05390 [Alphaproteobacteria bacterium]GHS97509.1 hypothetical protein AGMMS50296_4560 [Alphaproteobacteria bacterium]
MSISEAWEGVMNGVGRKPVTLKNINDYDQDFPVQRRRGELMDCIKEAWFKDAKEMDLARNALLEHDRADPASLDKAQVGTYKYVPVALSAYMTFMKNVLGAIRTGEYEKFARSIEEDSAQGSPSE